MLLRIRNLINRFERFWWSKSAYKFYLKELTQLKSLKKSSKLYDTLIFSKTIKPVVLDSPSKKRIAVIAPHPDDEIIGPGGTLLSSTKKSCTVDIIYLTSGGRKDFVVRENEAKILCDKIGWNSHFLRNEEGKRNWNLENLLKIIYKLKPQILMIPFILDDNKDHQFFNKLLFHNKAKLKKTFLMKTEIWAYQVYTAVFPNVVVDITDFKETKSELIKIYESQMNKRDWANFSIGLNAWTSRWLNNGSKSSWAESFYVVNLKEYINLLNKYY